MPDTTVRIPAWADPQQASVLDPWWKRTARMLGQVLGANDPTSQAMALGAPVELPGGAGGPGQKILKAFHGSPHDFDQFSLGKIGTGEGGQAYGHGLYFAENPAVAADYKAKLAPRATVSMSSTPVARQDIQKIADDLGMSRSAATSANVYSRLSTSDSVDHYLEQLNSIDLPSLRKSFPTAATEVENEYRLVSELKSRGLDVNRPNNGRMYEVNLHASPDELLDWDKPLSQQSPKVQEAIKKQYPALFEHGYYSERLTNPEFSSEQAGRARGVPADAMTGEHFYQFQVRQAGGRTPGHTEGIASQKLKDAGIKGIQYLDQGSRAAGEGTKNFVIFDDKIIEIAKKYGVALPAAAEIYRRQQQQIQGQSVNK